MRKWPPRRTIARVVDLTNWTVITSDDLLRADADEYQRIRRAATRARNENRDHFVCERCGFAVYAPREPSTRLPFWRHRKGAPTSCPWWTGDPSTVDAASAQQFAGAQESALHQRLKSVLAELLEGDADTGKQTVVIDRYLAGQSGQRRPDVRAQYGGRNLAFEIQLATTQIPIIDARETFYQREGYFLLWITWNFEPVPRDRMLTAFEDIFYSHNQNIFSIDEETIRLSRVSGRLQLRVFWQENEEWRSKIITLKELIWPTSGLPFASAPAPPWHEDFISRWLAATTDIGTEWPQRGELLNELAQKLDIRETGAYELQDAHIDDLINCILSFQKGHPVGSRQRNLVELANTFLASAGRHRYARVLKKVMEVTNQSEVSRSKSVSSKLAKALAGPQDDPHTMAGAIVLAVFPDLFRKPRVMATTPDNRVHL